MQVGLDRMDIAVVGFLFIVWKVEINNGRGRQAEKCNTEEAQLKGYGFARYSLSFFVSIRQMASAVRASKHGQPRSGNSKADDPMPCHYQFQSHIPLCPS